MHIYYNLSVMPYVNFYPILFWVNYIHTCTSINTQGRAQLKALIKPDTFYINEIKLLLYVFF